MAHLSDLAPEYVQSVRFLSSLMIQGSASWSLREKERERQRNKGTGRMREAEIKGQTSPNFRAEILQGGY